MAALTPPPEVQNNSLFGSIRRVAKNAVNGATGLVKGAANSATGVVKGAVNGATSVVTKTRNVVAGAAATVKNRVTGTTTGGRRCHRRHRHTRRCRKRSSTRRNKRYGDFSRI
jgi:hypothetical protein